MNWLPPTTPRQIRYEPTTFQAYYYAGNKPGIHIFPGDVVHTWAPDSAGTDKNLKRVALGGNAKHRADLCRRRLTRRDTLVVHLIKIAPNRATARARGSRIQQFAITPAYNLAAKYDQRFNGEWQVQNADGYATLTAPTPALKNFRIKMNPMLGLHLGRTARLLRHLPGRILACMAAISITTGLSRVRRCSFPVFPPGVRCSDSAMAMPRMGDGEVTQTGLETSMAVDFSGRGDQGLSNAGLCARKITTT